jgi:phosphonoacetate hydrolase
MNRKILIICVDGMGPDYLEAAPTPNIDQMAKEGASVQGRSVIPSVTNVNNVSIITGTAPKAHGITANYWLNRATGEEHYMESAEFLLAPTILSRAGEHGLRTALLTAKKKLLNLLNAGTDYAVSAEEPDAETREKIGPPQDIYSSEINHWILRAARYTLAEKGAEAVYCSTTDWTMHKFPPESEESQRHLAGIDAVIGRIADENPDLSIYLTADHGMSSKSRGADLGRALKAKGINGNAVPIIKDRYVAHHQNLGGSIYVYLEQPDATEEALACLSEVPGVEEVYSREAASREFGLMPDRIGDIFVLGDKDTVFGDFESSEVPVGVRSHGSRHESAVPIIAFRAPGPITYGRNLDIVRTLDIHGLPQ